MTDSVSFELKRMDLYRYALLQALRPRILLLIAAGIAVAGLPKLAEGGVAYLQHCSIFIASYPLFAGLVTLVRAPRTIAQGALGMNRVSIDGSGYRMEAPGSASCAHWHMVTDIRVAPRDVLFAFDSLRAQRIPRHAFASEAELQSFVSRARELRAGTTLTGPLPSLPQEAPLAQAEFELTRALAARAQRERITGNLQLRVAWVLVSLALAMFVGGGDAATILITFAMNLFLFGGMYVLFIWVTMRVMVRGISDKAFGVRSVMLATRGVGLRLCWAESWVEWQRIRSVRETKHFVLLTAVDDVKFVPKSCFQSPTGAADFATLARKLKQEAKGARAPGSATKRESLPLR